MNEIKTKAINLINGILNNVWNKRYNEDCPLWAEDINFNTLIVAWHLIYDDWASEYADLVSCELFTICDEIRKTPIYGCLLLPREITAISTPFGIINRDEYKVTKAILDEVLNDPIFAGIN